MNFKLIGALALTGIALLSSCKKDKDNNPSQPNPVNNSPLLKVGNYWVYETIQFDEQGNAYNDGYGDSTYIEKDTMMYGAKYYKQVSVGLGGYPYHYIYFWRDSSGVLINNYGVKPDEKYKKPGFIDSVVKIYNSDTIYEGVIMLDAQDTTITVPAGTFKTKNIKTLYKIHVSPGNYRYCEAVTLLSNEVGREVFSTNFYVSTPAPAHIENRLVRYHIAK